MNRTIIQRKMNSIAAIALALVLALSGMMAASPLTASAAGGMSAEEFRAKILSTTYYLHYDDGHNESTDIKPYVEIVGNTVYITGGSPNLMGTVSATLDDVNVAFSTESKLTFGLSGTCNFTMQSGSMRHIDMTGTGSFTMNGGTLGYGGVFLDGELFGCQPIVLSGEDMDLIVNGGKIVATYETGIIVNGVYSDGYNYVFGNGSFTMTGGEIVGNCPWDLVLCTRNNTDVFISGGTIQNTLSSPRSGASAISGSRSFHMTGGTIRGINVGYAVGDAREYFEMSGGEISAECANAKAISWDSLPYGSNANISVTGGTVSASGTNAAAIYIRGSNASIKDWTVSASGTSAAAISFGNDARLSITGGTVTADTAFHFFTRRGNGRSGANTFVAYKQGTVSGNKIYEDEPFDPTITYTSYSSEKVRVVEVSTADIPDAWNGTSNGLTVKDVNTYTPVWGLTGEKPQINFDGGEMLEYGTHAGAPGSFTAVTDISGVPTAATAGTPLTLTGTITPANATNKTITWNVKNAGATGATISGGVFTAGAAGTAVVTATVANGASASSDYTQDFTITVAAPDGPGDNGGGQQTGTPGTQSTPGGGQTTETPVPMANIPAAQTPLAPGKVSALPKSVAFTDGISSDVKWSSGDSGIAKIDADGNLIAVGEGKVTLTATATDGSGKTQTITVTIAKPVTAVRTPLTKIYLTKGTSLTLPVCADSTDAQGKPDTKAKLTYTSSNPKVATVDANGKIKVKGTGKATITITAMNGKSVKITVNAVAKAKKLKKLALVKPPKSLKLGKAAQLKLKLTPATATNLKMKFKVTGKAIKVDQAGKITAVKKGKAKITVSAGGKNVTKTITVK